MASGTRTSRLSLDSCCLNVKGKDPYLNQIFNLAKVGLIELYASERVRSEQSGQKVTLKYRRLYQKRFEETKSISDLSFFPLNFGKDGVRFIDENSSNMLKELCEICFPGQPWKNLTDNQKNDVRILEAHVSRGLDYFLTKNPNDFIKKGKKENLERLGINVREPNEEFLRELKDRI